MQPGIPLYTVDGDTVPPGGEVAYPRADVNTADGRPLFAFTGDAAGGPSTADGHGGFHAYTGDTVPVDNGTVTEPGPGSSTGEPSPELPATTEADVAAAQPGLTEGAGAQTSKVPDNPPSEVATQEPNTVDQTIDQAHGWDAGITVLDTGWCTPPGLPEAWNQALRDGHGEQDGFIKIPAHLREIEDAVLALATATMGNVGTAGTDQYRVEVEVAEGGDDVRVEARIRRRKGEPTGGDITPAVSDPATVTG